MSTENTRSNPKFIFMSKRTNVAIKLDLETEIANFLYAKRIEKRSPKTISAYEQALGQFAKWYRGNGCEEITPNLTRKYVHYLTFEKTRWDDHPTSPNGVVGLSPRTVNNVIRNMKIFFTHLIRERIISHSPMESIKYQTEDKDTFEIFTEDDVLRLLDAPNTRTYIGLRDRAMMLVLIDCGSRIGELTSLKISDVDFRMRQITFRAENTKTNTTRIVPISKRTAKELERLTEFMNIKPDDYLWLTQFGERYLADTFGKMLKKYAKKAAVTGVRVSPHTFRHFFAVSFLRGGGDVVSLSRLLGHTSVETTQIYLRFTATDLREQHEKASPVTQLLDKGNNRKRGKVSFK